LNPGVRRFAVIDLAFLAVAVPAAARTQAPHVFLGVLGDPGRFQQQTGQVSATRLRIVGWGQGATYGSPFAALLATMGTQPCR
jgi:hypothetical protein